MESYNELLNNAILLLALGVIYDTLGLYKIQQRMVRDILSGILVGLLGMLVMLTPWILAPGIFFDTRWVLISLSGLFFGLVPTLIAVVMTVALRLFQGGAGMYVGALVIIVSAVIGLAWRRLERERNWKLGWLNLYLFGLLVQLVVLACMYFLPAAIWYKVFLALAPPLLLIFPVGSLLLGMVLRSQRDRRATELELVENRKQLDRDQGLLRGLIDSIPDVIFFKDPEGRYLGCNQAFEKFVGASEQEVIGKTDRDLFTEEMAQQFEQQDQKVIATGIPFSDDQWVQLADGERHILNTRKTQFRGLDGTLYGLAGTSRDISDRWEAERELMQRQKEWEATFNAIEDIITIQDPSMRIIKANKATFDTFPHSKIIGEPCYTLFRKLSGICPECPLLDPDADYSDRDKIISHENLGKTFHVSATHVELPDREGDYIVHIAKDVTKQRELEGQLRQKYKMEAVGVMAGGMAHNFNNNLSIVMGNVELAKRRNSEPEAVNKCLDNAKTALLRSRDLIKQIMIFTRQEPHEMKLIRPSLIIEETLQLLHSTIPTTVEIQYQSTPLGEEATIGGDSTRLQEALINLCANAVHAMKETGTINITLDTHMVQQAEIPAQYHCLPGPYVVLKVKDSGSGMPPETLEKIFDPFFTTKDLTQGTGMGLATVQGVAEQHEGFIKVHSSVGEGTTFELYFPAEKKGQTEPVRRDDIFINGTEKILFIDDEEMLASLGEMMLAEMGYQATSQTNSVEALEMVKQDPDFFDLVVTDQTMPGLTGKELAEQLREIRPELPIILCTGYSSQITAEDSQQYGISAFCNKPLGMAELSRTIRSCLDKKQN